MSIVPKVGAMVQFTQEVKLEYPLEGTIPAGTLGLVLAVEEHRFDLFLNHHLDALTDWNNVLQTAAPGVPHNIADEIGCACYADSLQFVADRDSFKVWFDDYSIDALIRAYCEVKGYDVDGDIFSQAFNYMDDFKTVDHVIETIDEIAAIWNWNGKNCKAK